MKHRLVAIMAAALSFVLCGCTGPSQNQSSGLGEPGVRDLGLAGAETSVQLLIFLPDRHSKDGRSLGAEPALKRRVEKALQARGFHIDHIFNSSLCFSVTAPAPLVDETFAVSIHRITYKNAPGYAAREQPTVPEDLAGIERVVGTNAIPIVNPLPIVHPARKTVYSQARSTLGDRSHAVGEESPGFTGQGAR